MTWNHRNPQTDSKARTWAVVGSVSGRGHGNRRRPGVGPAGRQTETGDAAGYRGAGLSHRLPHRHRQSRLASGPGVPQLPGAADPDAALLRRHHAEPGRQQAGLAAEHLAAGRRAQRAADPDRRCRLRLELDLRRRRADADAGQRRQAGPALHPDAQHGAVFADPGGAAHRAQPPPRRLRRCGRRRHRLPRLQLDHRAGIGARGHDAEAERLLHRLVRQEPQRADLGGQPRRAVHQLADRAGLRLLLRLRRRRHQPVAAGQPVPQHHADPSLRRQAGLEPDHRHGRRRHRLHQQPDGHRPEAAVVHPLRAGRHPRAAPSDQGVGGQDQRHEAVRRRLGKAARAHLRQPEAARRHSRQREAAAPGRTSCPSGTR